MNTMTKLVNIKAPIAIRTVTPPIYGEYEKIIMTTGDILKCLCRRAIVDEVLPDGSTIRLNIRNYCIDNGAGLDAINTHPLVEKTVEVTESPITDSLNDVQTSASVENSDTDEVESVMEAMVEEESESVEETANDEIEPADEEIVEEEPKSVEETTNDEVEPASEDIVEDTEVTQTEELPTADTSESVDKVEDKSEAAPATKSNTTSKKKSSNNKSNTSKKK